MPLEKLWGPTWLQLPGQKGLLEVSCHICHPLGNIWGPLDISDDIQCLCQGSWAELIVSVNRHKPQLTSSLKTHGVIGVWIWACAIKSSSKINALVLFLRLLVAGFFRTCNSKSLHFRRFIFFTYLSFQMCHKPGVIYMICSEFWNAFTAKILIGSLQYIYFCPSQIFTWNICT